MYKPTALTPGQQVPDLDVVLTDGARWSLKDNAGQAFTLLNFYRGVHCPKCRENLQEQENILATLSDLGVNVLALSMDPQERADEAKTEWGLENTNVAMGLSVEQAKQWGLHISSGRGKTSSGHEETTIFNEPGTFLVRNDGTLYASWVQTVPFARPKPNELASMIKFVLEKDYPPRGTNTDV